MLDLQIADAPGLEVRNEIETAGPTPSALSQLQSTVHAYRQTSFQPKHRTTQRPSFLLDDGPAKCQ